VLTGSQVLSQGDSAQETGSGEEAAGPYLAFLAARRGICLDERFMSNGAFDTCPS